MEKENKLNNIEVPFLHKNLGFLKEGQTLKITLNVDQFNFKLLELNEFKKYKKGIKYNYWGGTIHTDTFTLTIPYKGYWFAVVDLNGIIVKDTIKHLLWVIK